MIETIQHNGNTYPALQAKHNAAKFAIPFALELIKPEGKTGYDIGFGKEEWKLPHAIGVDMNMDNGYDADNLPAVKVDYIFASHLLEHVPSWDKTLDYWYDKLHEGGIIFLYLPHYSQTYWRTFNNRKHVHNLNADLLHDYFLNKGMVNIFVTEGWDLNNSFYAVAEKK